MKTVITDLRKVLKGIKRSGSKRDKLRDLTSSPEFNGKRLNILLDTKTRWYSTITMLERAVRIMPAINAVLACHGDVTLGRTYQIKLRNILNVLAPLKQAMVCLCYSQSTLIHADRILMVLLDKLQRDDCELSSTLRAHVIEEMKQRRTKLSSLLQYLLNPAYDFALETFLGQRRMSEQALRDLILDILKRDFEASSSGPEDDNAGPENHQSANASSSAPLSFDDIFKEPLVRPMDSPSEPTAAKVRLEMKLREAGQGHGKLLESCLRKLSTVQPTSVQPERDFSAMNSVCSESRNCLAPQTLDNPVVLRAYIRRYSDDRKQ